MLCSINYFRSICFPGDWTFEVQSSDNKIIAKFSSIQSAENLISLASDRQKEHNANQIEAEIEFGLK